MSKQKNVTLRVIEQGAVIVDGATVHRESPGIVCIHVDLHSKRAETVRFVEADSPALYFSAGKGSLYLDESKPRDRMTIVDLPEYAGWRVFACDGPNRYTLAVVLVDSLVGI